MKKEHQGARWRRLDNTAKIFPIIANENLSNVFRLSATLKEEVDPELLQMALEEVLPLFEGFCVRLRRGFFWYYFEWNKRTPLIEKESTYPCKYIAPRSHQMFLFRVSYYGNRINLEVFHAISDGMGAVNFLRELTYRYLQLKRGHEDVCQDQGRPSSGCSTNVEDSYIKNYKITAKQKYTSVKAYWLTGDHLPLDAENIIHHYVDLDGLKAVCKRREVSITKFLAACLIWSIWQAYLDGQPFEEPIAINLPINLRAFFQSETTANFFAVTVIQFLARNQDTSFDEILSFVSRQMDEKIVREKLEQTISYNVSSEKKWYIRIVPLIFKWMALNLIFRKNDRAHTVTLSNIGPISVESEYREDIERFHLIIGVSERQPAKCGVCAFGKEIVVSFTTIFADNKLAESFSDTLKMEGIPVKTEGNCVAGEKLDQGMYPKIIYDANKWKKIVNIFYAVVFALAAILGVVNAATYSGSLWSLIAIGCIIYGAMTVKYSVMRHSNLGAKIVIQTLGAQVLLGIIDYVTGYTGWSMNYAIPSTILFADIAVVFLIIVNRLNWQSYLMYQITITIFSFIPLILWAAGLITNPVMSIITVIITVLILVLIMILGDRSVKRELIRRFHL